MTRAERGISMKREEEPAGSIALALGPAAAIATAGLLGSIRDDVGVTNVALILSFIVVIAALMGRAAGVVTAIVAGLSLNFFHTEPFHSLRISSGRDVATVLLLTGLGILVSEMSAWRRRAHYSSVRRLHGAQALRDTAALIAARSEPNEVWNVIQPAILDLLDLADCRYEPGSSPSAPPMQRSGTLVAHTMHLGRDGFEISEDGAAIAVTFAGHTMGHIVMRPLGHRGSPRDAREVAVALADLYAVALVEQQFIPGA